MRNNSNNNINDCILLSEPHAYRLAYLLNSRRLLSRAKVWTKKRDSNYKESKDIYYNFLPTSWHELSSNSSFTSSSFSAKFFLILISVSPEWNWQCDFKPYFPTLICSFPPFSVKCLETTGFIGNAVACYARIESGIKGTS